MRIMMYTGKQLRALVMPLMFEQFLNVMVGMVDTLMVSKAGEAAGIRRGTYD